MTENRGPIPIVRRVNGARSTYWSFHDLFRWQQVDSHIAKYLIETGQAVMVDGEPTRRIQTRPVDR